MEPVNGGILFRHHHLLFYALCLFSPRSVVLGPPVEHFLNLRRGKTNSINQSAHTLQKSRLFKTSTFSNAETAKETGNEVTASSKHEGAKGKRIERLPRAPRFSAAAGSRAILSPKIREVKYQNKRQL